MENKSYETDVPRNDTVIHVQPAVDPEVNAEEPATEVSLKGFKVIIG